MCLRGVSELQERWLENDANRDLSVHVVWVPQLGAEPRHVPEAAALMPDPRARHWWDGGQTVGRRFAEALAPDRDPGPLWDVYFLYGPDARWEDAPLPEPLALWMQQLRSITDLAPPLDADVFAARADRLADGGK